jgi:hypothetical protein
VRATVDCDYQPVDVFLSAVTNGYRRYGESGGGRTARPARCGTGGEFVLTETVARLLGGVVAELGIPTVASLARTNPRVVTRIMRRESRVTRVETADVLITDVLDDPSLWLTEPGLELVDWKGRRL